MQYWKFQEKYRLSVFERAEFFSF